MICRSRFGITGNDSEASSRRGDHLAAFVAPCEICLLGSSRVLAEDVVDAHQLVGIGGANDLGLVLADQFLGEG